MRRIILCITILATIQSCATQKTLQFINGSKVDGMVTLGFDYTNLQKPQWDTKQGLQQAEHICKGWGYKGASWLVNDQTCNYMSHSNHRIGDVVLHTNECTAARLMVKYQCTSQSNETQNKTIQSNNYQPLTPAPTPSSYQNVPATQPQPAQSVVEQNTVTPVPVTSYQNVSATQPLVQPEVEQSVSTYQQPQAGNDLRYCLSLADNNAIAECVRKAKR